jgi:hypothetical protein
MHLRRDLAIQIGLACFGVFIRCAVPLCALGVPQIVRWQVAARDRLSRLQIAGTRPVRQRTGNMALSRFADRLERFLDDPRVQVG